MLPGSAASLITYSLSRISSSPLHHFLHSLVPTAAIFLQGSQFLPMFPFLFSLLLFFFIVYCSQPPSQFLSPFSSTHFLLFNSFPSVLSSISPPPYPQIPLQRFSLFPLPWAKFPCLIPCCELAPNSLLCMFTHHKPRSDPPTNTHTHTHTALDSFRKSPPLPFLAGPPLSTSSCWPPRSLSPAYFLLTFAGPPSPLKHHRPSITLTLAPLPSATSYIPFTPPAGRQVPHKGSLALHRCPFHKAPRQCSGETQNI